MIIQIKDGRIENGQAFQNLLSETKDGEYILKRYKRIRSEEQNRYYRGLLGIVEKETGSDRDDTHEKMRMKFLSVPSDGKSLPFCRSTTKLTTSEFCEYIENVKNFMAQFGLILPSAEEFENYVASYE